MSKRDIKTGNTVADAYRSMYAKPIEINEDILNEELIDSLIEELRQEESLDENIQSVIKKYPRDNDWKKLVMKHKIHVDAFRKNGKDMPKKVEDEFLSWAMSNNEIKTDDSDESDEWLMDTIQEAPIYAAKKKGKKKVNASHCSTESSSKYDANILKSVADTYASMQKYGIQGDVVEDLVETNLQEGTWAIPDSKDKLEKLNRAMVRPHLIKKEGDLDMAAKKFAGLVGDDSVMDKWYKMFLDYEDVKKVSDAREPVVEFLKDWGVKLSGYKITHAPATWVSGMDDDDQDTRKIDETLEEGLFDKLKKKWKGKGKIKKKRDKILKVEENSVMSAPKQNMSKIKPMLTKLANKHKKVKVSFGTHSKGKFVDDNNINFNGDKKDIEMLMKDIEKDKKLMKLMEETQLDEVQKVEVDAMKKLSKDMQAVMKGYQKIANMGDKELKNTVHNKNYKAILDARDKVLTLIGTLNTKMLLQKENFEVVQEGAEEMIDKLFNLKGNRIAGLGVAMLLNMTDVKVIQAMQKQNPQGFMKTVNAMGKETGKIKPATEKEVMKMFKRAGVKPLPEEIDEKVKDGKLDPLSKMGKSKLTGSEIQKYYRDNPKQKAAARDKTVKKAIELALDLSGATNYAIKEIEKLKRGLSKLPAVKLAIRHANEEKEFTGHHVVIEQLSPKDLIKLKTYGKMLAKITKLPFDDSNPEKSIDKLMGQIWQQKHSPANWDRLHKMVGMLKGIGVKMPSLKGKYMGYDPVAKKSIFYKEENDEMIEWYQKIDDIKEGIEELVEKKEMSAADIKKIAQMTDRNDHTGSLMHLAKLLGDRKGLDALKGIMMTHKAIGHMPDGLMKTRNQIHDNLMRQSSSKYSNHKDVISSF